MQKDCFPFARNPASGNHFIIRIGFSLVLLGGAACPAAAQSVTPITPPSLDVERSQTTGTETAVFAGGCFWGVQAVFQHIKGVTNAVSGYAGGSVANPSYRQVSSGRTGHAESVEVTFDPSQISYSRLLEVFFSVAHDPTQLNRQGPDEGTQYRSAIFATSEAQRDAADAYIAELGKAHAFPRPVVTKVEPLEAFYPAESYHQDYATFHPDSGYIVVNDLPKIENLQRLYPELYRERPVLVSDTGH
jgi:peptide-methionine (S)-S-oxide reductase